MPASLEHKERVQVEKVRAGFYRVGAYCIHKGHWWCCYLKDKPMPHARYRRLQEAVWWAQHNQPRSAERAWPTNSSFA
jgi:hypothetical protein